MKFGAVTCEVVCGGVPLEEHKVEYDTDTRTATCYIESEEGQVRSSPTLVPLIRPISHRLTDGCRVWSQTFSVRWSEDPYDPRAPKGSVGHVYLDDQSQAGRVLDRGNLLASVSGRNVSDSTEKPFVFSRIVREPSRLPASVPTVRLLPALIVLLRALSLDAGNDGSRRGPDRGTAPRRVWDHQAQVVQRLTRACGPQPSLRA